MQKASVQNVIIDDFSAHKRLRCFSAFLSPGIHDDELKEEKRKLAKRRTKLTSESLQLPPEHQQRQNQTWIRTLTVSPKSGTAESIIGRKCLHIILCCLLGSIALFDVDGQM